MPEPKNFIMTPNAEHSETTGLLEIVPDIATWITYQLTETPVPTFQWTINNSTGEIVATLNEDGEVFSAHVWCGYSCGNNLDSTTNTTIKRRDFRIENMDSYNGKTVCELCGVVNTADGRCLNVKSFWKKEKLTVKMVRENNKLVRTYSALMPAPEDGRWVAFFIDIIYEKPKEMFSSSAVVKGRQPILPKDLPGQLQFTTEVSIVPIPFPFDDCTGSTCSGKIV
jgi:hypothetical protein